MTDNFNKKILSLTRDLQWTNRSQHKHFSFIVLKNRIISIGKNYENRTHPFAARLSNTSESIHSEMDAYLNIRWFDIDYSKCILINTLLIRKVT